MPRFISPTGFIDQNVESDNIYSEYSLNFSNTKSREKIDPKTDLSFYYNNYISPKYGLHNINVSNCVGFMKDLEINWSNLDDGTKSKILDVLVDGIMFNNKANIDFKMDLLNKLNIKNKDIINTIKQMNDKSETTPVYTTDNKDTTNNKGSNIIEGNVKVKLSDQTGTIDEGNSKIIKESFGKSSNKNKIYLYIIGTVIILFILFFVFDNVFKLKLKK